jgi:hypothetical protein
VVWDDFRGDREHTYDWFFHAMGDQLVLSGVSTNRPADTRTSGEFPYPFITGVRAQQLTESDAEATWSSSNKTGLTVWLMGETNDSLFSARCPTTDGKTIPLLVLRKSAKDCQFVNVLQPWAGQPVKMEIHADRSDPNNLRLTITQPGRTDVILLNPQHIGFDFNAGGSSREKQLDAPLASAGTLF